MEDSTLIEVKDAVKDKLNGWYEKVDGIELDDLRLNVFLASMMGMQESRDLVHWYLGERVERSIVTSFGFLIEDIALKVSGGKSWSNEGGDIVLEKEGRPHYIEIKSGTASSNVKMMRNTSNAQERLKEDMGDDIVTVLGLTYGKKDEVFGTMTGYYEGDKMLVGKELWEFLTGESGAHEEVLKTITDAREEVQERWSGRTDLVSGAVTIQELIEAKEEKLTKEWEKRYGKRLTYKKIIERLF